MIHSLNYPAVLRRVLHPVFVLLIAMGSATFTCNQQVEPAPFRQALPGYTFAFPRDLNSHDDFKIEWWYYTGNLEDANGRPFGYQLTFFRVALDGAGKIKNPSRWRIDQVYFAHLAVSDIESERFYFFERINRRGLNTAGAEPDRLRVWNEDWQLTGQDGAHILEARESGTGLSLTLAPAKNPVVHGKSGVSVKGREPGNASHYFSYTRMDTRGTLSIDGREYKVSGSSWMDHEFSSNQLGKEQVGWDWFALTLDNQVEIMLYRIRLKNGDAEPFSSGTLVRADGSHRHLPLRDFSIMPTGQWTSRNTQITHPAGWRIALPQDGVRLEIRPDMADQELYGLRSISGSYWEGSVSVTGRFKNQPVHGKGYVELVGYGKALDTGLPD